MAKKKHSKHVEHKHPKKESEYVHLSQNSMFIIGIVVFLLAVFILIAPTKTSTYQVEVSYTDTETYTEKEPYEIQEPYQVQEPYESVEYYTDTVPVEQSIPYQDYEVYNAGFGQSYSSCGSSCSCTSYNFWGNCVQCTCIVTRYRTEIVYQEIQKQRPVTKYRTVTKFRTVTKYRDVAKTREVIKTRMESRQMEVNWIWGFKVPWKIHLRP